MHKIVGKARKARKKARREQEQKTLEEELTLARETLRQLEEKGTPSIAQTSQPQEIPKKSDELKEASSEGSAMIDKVNESLDVILKDFGAKLKTRQTQEHQWLTYPNAEQEIERFEMSQRLLQTAKTML